MGKGPDMAKFHPHLDPVQNDACERCSPTRRREYTEDYLCQQAVGSDGLPVRCVGRWAIEKLTRLLKYFEMFTVAVRGKRPLNYLEICSGPGRCIMRESGEEINGTALAIVKEPVFAAVTQAIFVDYNTAVTDALQARLAALRVPTSKARVVAGNYKDVNSLEPIIRQLARLGALTLVCIDPTSCDVPFNTVSYLKQGLGRADFVINAAIGTDANRNLGQAFLDPKQAPLRRKYADFLNCPDFFNNDELRRAAMAGNAEPLRNAFAEAYERSLQHIGLEFVARCSVKHYYQLVFASAHELGLHLWREANLIEPDGQRMFGFCEEQERYG